MSAPPLVQIEHVDEAIALLVLNRPEVLNAISLELIQELELAFHKLSKSQCRVIILCGRGPSFCAGADLKACVFGVGGQQWDSSQIENQERFSNLILRMREMNQPIIACVQGSAAGGGMCLALASDILICTRTTKFIASFANIGLSGCELGTSYFLPRAIGPGNANRYLLTGEALLGEEAYRLGLAQFLLENEAQMMDKAMQLAKRMVDNMSPLGLRLTKRQLNAAMDGMSLAATLQAENAAQLLCINSPATAEFSLNKVARFNREGEGEESKL